MSEKEKSLISFLTFNEYHFREKDSFIIFCVTYNNQEVTIYFDKNKSKYYVDEKFNFNKYIPHIINHWEGECEGTKLAGICLTMDNTLRSTTFPVRDEIFRIKQIVFEKWNDKVAERFKELEIMLQPKQRDHYIYRDAYEFLALGYDFDSFQKQTPTKLELINLKFVGQKLDEIRSYIHEKSTRKSGLISFEYNKKCKRFYFEKHDDKIKFFSIEDYSKNALFARASLMKQLSSFDNIVIIGAGAIGSATAEYLVRNGVENIHVYDDDRMHAHNSPRHATGYNPFMQNNLKTEQLKAKLLSTMPFANVKFYNSIFEFDEKLLKGRVLLINTTGGAFHTLIKRYLELYKKLAKGGCYLDIFIEPFGAAVHFISSSTKLEDVAESLNIFSDIVWEKRMIANPNKDFRDNFQGCFVSTLPYGYAPIQVAIPLIFNTIEKKGFELGHFTIPMIELSGIKWKNLNKDCEIKFNKRRIGVHKWK